MFFKVPGDVEISVSPSPEVIHELIESAIEDGAEHIDIVIQVIRRETLN